MSFLKIGKVRLWFAMNYVWTIAVMWTLVMSASLAWNYIQARQYATEAARIQARATYEKDVIYRRWNSGHGGVYAPVTDTTQPNPYLEVPYRDITLPSGDLYTLINPAYMTRQVLEIGKETANMYGHITSLNPIRPENVADSWETTALQAFKEGETEVSSLEVMEGEEYLRFMRPLITEQSCLKCHEKQGYKIGDIRGGISVSIPMGPFWNIASKQIQGLTTAHFLLWLCGLASIVLWSRRLSYSQMERDQAQKELHKAYDELETFAYSISHDLRAPLRAINFLSKILQEDYEDVLDEEGNDHLSKVQTNAIRMNKLIDDLLALSRLGRQAINRTTTKLAHTARRVFAEITQEETDREFDFQIAEQAQVEADDSLMEVVLTNLLANAVKFTRGKDPTVIKFGVEKQGDKTVFYIKDNGVGFEMKHAKNLFAPFQRLHSDREFEGTGIGLATVQRIIQRHGGSIWVESKLNKGATFYFTLGESSSPTAQDRQSKVDSYDLDKK